MLLFTTKFTEQLGTDEEILEQFKESCELCGFEVPSEKDGILDERVLEWAQSCIDNQWTDFYKDLPNIECLMTGTCGLWNGNFEGGKVDSLRKLIQGGNYDDIRIGYDGINGTLTMTGWHHDGSNNFVIRALTKKGSDYYDKHCYDEPKEVHKYLLNTKGCTKRIKLWNT